MCSLVAVGWASERGMSEGSIGHALRAGARARRRVQGNLPQEILARPTRVGRGRDTGWEERCDVFNDNCNLVWHSHLTSRWWGHNQLCGGKTKQEFRRMRLKSWLSCGWLLDASSLHTSNLKA